MADRWDQFERAEPQSFGRLAVSPGLIKDVTQAVGEGLASLYETIKRWQADPSLPSSRGDTDIGADAFALGPGMLLPGFGRAAGGLGAAGGGKSAWTPAMVRKLKELDAQFAGETARGARSAKVVENFREVFPDYQGSDATIKTMASRAKNWGGVNESAGAAEAAGRESGSELGVFGGRIGARNLEAAGRPAPRQALDMAEKMEEAGHHPDKIRHTVNEWIARNDPQLGGVTRGADDQWRFEISDKNAKLTPELQQAFDRGELHRRDFTVGEGLDHPELLRAYPDIADTEFRVHKSNSPTARGFHQDKIGRSPELEALVGKDNGRISATSDTAEGIRSIALHEGGAHAVQAREGFARGSAAHGSGYVGLDDAVDILGTWQGKGSLTRHIEDLQARGELPLEYGSPRRIADRVNYWRSSGEVEARNVQTRRDMTPAEQRRIDPKFTQDIPDEFQLVRRPEAGPEAAVGTGDVERIARDLGLDAQGKTVNSGTTYFKVRDPAAPDVGSVEVRVPSADDPHGGRFRRWQFDTSMEGTNNPHPNHFNAAGEDLANPDVLRDRLSYTFGKQSPDAPVGAPVEGGPINDPRQLKLLSRGLPMPNIWDQFERAE